MTTRPGAGIGNNSAIFTLSCPWRPPTGVGPVPCQQYTSQGCHAEMAKSARRRFIGLITVSYGLLAFAWIILSDKLLFALAGSADTGWRSAGKGLVFVPATDFLLFFSLCPLPAAPHNWAT